MTTPTPAGSRYCPLCEAYLDADVCPTDRVATVRADLARTTTEDDALGRVVGGRYRVERLLGQGAAGRVYAATQLSIGREVALKLLQPQHARSRHHMRRFYREARAATRLHSPHVVEVHDFGVDDESGAPYLVMELMRGESLAAWLAARGPASPRVAGRLLAPVARALADAERAGIVHRDLKPSNILLQPTGDGREVVKVADFGIAKELGAGEGTEQLTALGAAIGTPAYMAPEQASGGDVDPRADRYALGCILYELLAGHPPFPADTRARLLSDHLLEAAPALPSPLPSGAPAPSGLADLVAALLAKDPAARPSAAATCEALEALARGDDPVAALPEAPAAGLTLDASTAAPAEHPPAEALAGERVALPAPVAPLAVPRVVPGRPKRPVGAIARALERLDQMLWPPGGEPGLVHRVVQGVDDIFRPPEAGPEDRDPSATVAHSTGFWPFRRRSAQQRLLDKARGKRRRWMRHLRLFLVVNGGLFLLNLLTGGAPWFAMVFASWGIPFGVHALTYRAWRDENEGAIERARVALGLAPEPAARALPAPAGDVIADPRWAALLDRCRRAVAAAERALADVPPDPYATVDPAVSLRGGLADIERLVRGADRLERTLAEVTPGRAAIRAQIDGAEKERGAATDPQLAKMIDANLELLRARERRLLQLEGELTRMRVSAEGFALAAENVRLDATRIASPRAAELAGGLDASLRRLDEEVSVLDEVEAALEEL